MLTAKQAKAVAERYQKAVELVEAGKVFRLYGGHEGDYVVINGQGQAYLVNVISGECSCPDSQYRCSTLDILCKHALAASIVHERTEGAGEHPQPQAEASEASEPVNPSAACQRCGYYTVETDQRYCPDCQQAIEEEQARRLLEYLF